MQNNNYLVNAFVACTSTPIKLCDTGLTMTIMMVMVIMMMMMTIDLRFNDFKLFVELPHRSPGFEGVSVCLSVVQGIDISLLD